ncbi:MAG: phosphoglycerate dehydrogenase [Bacteroidota bacterium]
MYRVLVSAPYLIPEFERFRSLFEAAGIEVLLAQVKERLSEEELMPYAGRIDGALCGDDQFSSEVIKLAAPRLKVISKWGTGIDSIDSQAAQDHRVAIFNTSGAFTDSVADTVMGYVLNFARRLGEMDRSMKRGDWAKLQSRALGECTLGVIGIGRIGKAVLSRASAFGMSLLGNDIVEIDPNFVSSVGLRMVALDELLSNSDYVSLNCDLNPTSRHLINEQTLALMKSHAVLINSARGPVVDEAALTAALSSGRLAGAALDVFEEEPLPLASPLRKMENVLLAPHNANSSPSAWERVHWNSIRNLFVGLGLPPPQTPAGVSG